MEKKKILVVDDEPDVRAYLRSLLEDNEYEVIVAENGKLGMERALKESPDLICLDITMPEETGVRMLRNIQGNEKTKNIPVVIVTGVDPQFEDFIKSRKQIRPPEAYFEKPINQEDFLSTLKKLLS